MITAEKIHEEIQKDGTTKYYLKTRKFLGKTEDFDTPEQASFEKAHLKAYLKGVGSFRHRYKGTPDNRQPAIYPVMEGVFKVEMTEEEVNKYKAKHTTKV
mgnify:CR=1 FL=1